MGTEHFGVGRDFLASKYFLRGVFSWELFGGVGEISVILLLLGFFCSEFFLLFLVVVCWPKS